MINEINKMTKEEIKIEIGELEHSYAEVLQEIGNYQLLYQIWKRIKELQTELGFRK